MESLSQVSEPVSGEVLLERASDFHELIKTDSEASEQFATWLVGYLEDRGYRQEIDETTAELLIRYPDGHLEPHDDFVQRNFPVIFRMMVTELVQQGRITVQ